MNRNVKINYGNSGGSVIVDDLDLTDKVNFVAFQVEPGKTVPVVTLGISGAIEFEGEAVVEMITEQNLEQTIMAFLDAVEVDKLEEAALESEDIDKGVTKAVLAQLKRMAKDGS